MKVSLPPFFTMSNGYTVRLTAQDPTSGAELTSVVVSDASVAVDPDETTAPAQNVPLTPGLLY
jgi:hypothetical protein